MCYFIKHLVKNVIITKKYFLHANELTSKLHMKTIMSKINYLCLIFFGNLPLKELTNKLPIC